MSQWHGLIQQGVESSAMTNNFVFLFLYTRCCSCHNCWTSVRLTGFLSLEAHFLLEKAMGLVSPIYHVSCLLPPQTLANKMHH